jgi:hypothetical protein
MIRPTSPTKKLHRLWHISEGDNLLPNAAINPSTRVPRLEQELFYAPFLGGSGELTSVMTRCDMRGNLKDAALQRGITTIVKNNVILCPYPLY